MTSQEKIEQLTESILRKYELFKVPVEIGKPVGWTRRTFVTAHFTDRRTPAMTWNLIVPREAIPAVQALYGNSNVPSGLSLPTLHKKGSDAEMGIFKLSHFYNGGPRITLDEKGIVVDDGGVNLAGSMTTQLTALQKYFAEHAEMRDVLFSLFSKNGTTIDLTWSNGGRTYSWVPTLRQAHAVTLDPF